MPQSYSKCIVHIVFATKYRHNSIPTKIIPELHAYIATICRRNECEAFKVGGIENHVHIAASQSRTITASKLLEEIKAYSSKWMKQHNPQFAWQDGYGLFSISPSHLPRLVRYIENQAEHHAIRTFDSELERLAKIYGVKIDMEHEQ